jgi:hypothetical protein
MATQAVFEKSEARRENMVAAYQGDAALNKPSQASQHSMGARNGCRTLTQATATSTQSLNVRAAQQRR